MARAADVEADIARLLHGMFDKPGAALEVAPVVVAGDFAIADWNYKARWEGGLCSGANKGPDVTLCAGDGIRSREALKQAGVPQQEAIALEQALNAGGGEARSAADCKVLPVRGNGHMDGGAAQSHEHQR